MDPSAPKHKFLIRLFVFTFSRNVSCSLTFNLKVNFTLESILWADSFLQSLCVGFYFLTEGKLEPI